MVAARRASPDNRLIVGGIARPRADRWREAIQAVLADGGPEVVYQPIIDLQRGTVTGYESLARFTPWGQARPHEWFARAEKLGLGARLQAAVARTAFADARDLPRGCFLGINLSITGLLGDDMQSVFEAQRSLRGVVLELTDLHAFSTRSALPEVLAGVRKAGARIAVNEAGSGYAGLNAMMAVDPDLVKIDRTIVKGIDADPAKLALAEVIGAFTSRIDAWVLAEGVEREAELDALLSIGVPLAQGFLFGAASAGWGGCDPIIADHIRDRSELATRRAVGAIREPVALVHQSAAPVDPPAQPCILVDDLGVAVGFCLAEGRPVLPDGGPMQVLATEHAALVLERAMARPPERRWQPLVCTDDDGRPTGIIRVDDLARTVSRLAQPGRGISMVPATSERAPS